MARCVYNLFGHTFNSEFELDNFLLNNRISIENGNISDIVFSISQDPQLITKSIVDKIRAEAEPILDIKKVARIKSSEELTKQQLKLSKGYRGVTSAIEEMRDNTTGKLFTPKFILSNYKQKLKEDWARDGIAQSMMPILLLTYDPNRPYIVSTDEEFEKLFDKLLKSWDNISKLGTSLHKIFELYWKNSRVEPLWYLLQLQNDSQFRLFFQGLDEQQKLNRILDAIGVIESIKKDLQNTYGKNAIFEAEVPIVINSTIEDKDGDNVKLLGVIDLLVIDEQGRAHIFDYKFSSKEFTEWTYEKLLCNKYQQGFYKAGVESKGIDMSQSDVGIIPLLLSDFDGETYGLVGNYTGIESFNLALYAGSDILRKVLSKVVMPEYEKPKSSKDFLPKVLLQFKKIFPGYKLQIEIDEEVKKTLERDIKEVKIGTDIVYRLPNYGLVDNGKRYVDYESYAEAYTHLSEYRDEILRQNNKIVNDTIGNIKTAMRNGDPSKLIDPGLYNRKLGINRSWFYNKIARYCTPMWEVTDIPEFEQLGILTFHNKIGDYYIFICIENMNLKTKVPFKKGNKITGNFIDDITPEQYGVDLLNGDYGNIDNMKVMLAINNYPELFKRAGVTLGKVGDIFVINPREQTSHPATMKLLRDNFRLLCSYAGITNNIENGTIRCMDYVDMARETLRELGNADDANKRLNKIYSEYEHSSLSIENTKESLLRLRQTLREQFKHLTKASTMDMNAPETEIYIYVEKALLSVNDIHHVQELEDSKRLATLILAPSRQNSKNLQNLNKTAKEVYRLIRKDMTTFAGEARSKFDKYEKEKGFNTFRKLTINDEPLIYKNLFRDDPDKSGVYKFKNPYTDPTLKPEEKELLKWVLSTLYKFKHMGEVISPEALVEAKNDPESDYYDVPLLNERSLKNKLMSPEGRKGFASWVKEGFEKLKNPVKSIKRLDLNSLSQELSDEYYRDMERFEVLDIFEYSEDEVRRKALLLENSRARFSSNLKEILFEYANAKIRKKHMDNYIPIFESYLSIERWEANASNVTGIPITLLHIQDFVNAKILDRSLVSDNYKVIAKGLLFLRNVTTYSTLAFSPRSFGFQRIEGMFKNASRSVIRPNGVAQFGFEEYKKALLFIEGATKDFAKAVSMALLLNEAYGLNDLDMNSLAKRLKQGMLPGDFMGQMMWLTTIPDFYNRMAMFVAQMIKDGCFEAHEVKGTKLVYNWKKDKRFSVFANANGVVPTDPEKRKIFNFQKALYHAKMEEFLKAGYKVTDEFGNERDLLFDPMSNKPGDDLPQAYTFNEANDLKSYSDLIYGYYNHEDLMMLKSQMLGASYLLFRAWWSSLANRYWLKGGVYNRTDGEYVLATIRVTKTDENGNEYQEDVPAFKRFFVDENGKPIGFELTDEDTGEPAIVWKGKYFEGILNTIWGGLKAMFKGDPSMSISERAVRVIKGNFDENANEEVKRVRLKNMLILAHDFTLWAIIGLLSTFLIRELLRELAKRDKNRKLNFGEKTLRNLESIGASSLVAATMDLGAVSDLLDPLTNWNPPSLQVAQKIGKDMMSVITGDKTFGRALLSNIGVARQSKEYWYKATSLAAD